jgi:thiamine-phosphate pyrophosphorylase
LRERLLLVTDVEVAGGVDALAEKLTLSLAAVPPGTLLVELRDKQRDDRAALAERVGAICRAAGARWVVNGDLMLASTYAADGVHLPEHDAHLHIDEGRRAGLVGVSTHSVDSALRFRNADYVILGPIWPTASKPGHPGAGLSILAGVDGAPVFAIGGVDSAERARACRAAGAHGVAVIRAILAADDPGAAAAALVAAL